MLLNSLFDRDRRLTCGFVRLACSSDPSCGLRVKNLTFSSYSYTQEAIHWMRFDVLSPERSTAPFP